MKAKLFISYNGAQFGGFARQKNSSNLKTVTDSFEFAMRRCGIFSPLIGAGRTDVGVHATRQCVTFELPKFWEGKANLGIELSRKLHSGIQIKSCQIVDDGFNPRFDAKKRCYRYIVSTKKPSVFENDFCLFIDKKMDMYLLSEALRMVSGTHDFALFKKSGGSEARTIRTLKAYFYKKDHYLIFCFESTSFLRSQIRILMAAILGVGGGGLSLDMLKEQLGCLNKHVIKPVAPNGLYLSRIVY